MNNREEQFEKIVCQTLIDIDALLLKKGKEYRRDDNPYHNFEKGAQISGNTREEVLQGFLLKHLISVDDIRNDLKQGKSISIAHIQEKYDDILVYFIIEKSMMIESALNSL